ncbi:hypothetical protein B0T10DRAFT_488301 [Thelonectria olida]|uniref:Protein kinase domain-containing protein n=1 Tax=Thelonectria olida TaxID=1576542 RepID=A0A9P8W2J6_9HYPO|nr:hypothetical protein B0T10DRAFT_488301 [Thelonectria olida]
MERTRYCEGIEAGIRHLYQLGLIHRDINPTNIIMDGDTPVIIDFDSCVPVGEKLGEKTATPDWQPKEGNFTTAERNFYGLKKLKDFILHDIKPPFWP